MHLLWIATKPPWPASDGGRLAQALTLEALARSGVQISVVAPAVGDVEAPPKELASQIHLETVDTNLRSRLGAIGTSWLTGRPVALVRHDLPKVRRRVAELVGQERFDAVHVEQLHGWPQSDPVRSLSCLLRMQNVESDLWGAVGRRGGPRGWVARREARLLVRAEGEILRRARTVVALTPADARRLSELAGDRKVEIVPPPFPSRLPAAERSLAGDPPVVLLGSGGWWPNRDARTWLTEEIWPRVAARVPGAVLHRFGGASRSGISRDRDDRIVDHESPRDSRDAFAPNGILVVPLRIASGIRMKILEAWARGTPVVATPRAAAGLGADDGRELLLASEAEEFARAVERLAGEEGLRGRLVQGGRQALENRHDGPRIARRLRGLYLSGPGAGC